MGFVYVVPLVAFKDWAETKDARKPRAGKAVRENMVSQEEERNDWSEVDMTKRIFKPTYLCRSTRR
jgi:hypothetical protein